MSASRAFHGVIPATAIPFRSMAAALEASRVARVDLV
jgi:hypothetical protein